MFADITKIFDYNRNGIYSTLNSHRIEESHRRKKRTTKAMTIQPHIYILDASLQCSRAGNNRKILIFRCNKPMQWCNAKNANTVLTGANKSSSPFVGGVVVAVECDGWTG